jgi:hypothetical protein
MNKIKYFKKHLNLVNVSIILAVLNFLISPGKLFAEDEKKATIKLSFSQHDSVKTCKATVTSENTPVKEIEVHFYVQRSYSLLPIGKAIATDENGEASADFPTDIPGDKNGNYVAVVKIEDDDTYGNVETQQEIKWGVQPDMQKDKWNSRSLSASREKAPMYLIIASNLIIAVIWGTILYVIFQIFRIKKESRVFKKN